MRRNGRFILQHNPTEAAVQTAGRIVILMSGRVAMQDPPRSTNELQAGTWNPMTFED